jgi:minor extracellular protease Epr
MVRKRSVKHCISQTLLCVWFVTGCTTAFAQVLPDVLPSVQSAVDRQTERAREQAVIRASEQAAQRAQEQAAARAQDQSAAIVQEQVRERAQTLATDRVQEQAVERVSTQAAGRALNQVENLQNQPLERVQEQAGRGQQAIQGQINRAQPANPITGPAVTLPVDLPANANAPAVVSAPDALMPGDLPAAEEPESGAQGNAVFMELAIEPNTRAIAREWVMLLTRAERELLDSQAPQLMQYLIQSSAFNALDSVLLRFRVPPDLDANDRVLQLVPENLRQLMDRNHLYLLQGEGNTPEGGAGPSPANELLSLPMNPVCTDAVSVGVIDSAVNVTHKAFQTAFTGADSPLSSDSRQPRLITRNFLDKDLEAATGHGTAIAGVMIGQGPQLRPLLPAGRIYNASVVYTQGETHQGASLMYLLEALDWMIDLDVQVINMSLTGPANRLLEQGVKAANARGKLIVAAAGNAGPHAEPFYPAAYEGVVSVTAVDRLGTVYRWANQGNHIDFAALGVSVPTARGDGSFGAESGTSMAAPVVSAFLACALHEHQGVVDAALSALKTAALDLGTPGHDRVFGHGLLHP